MSGQVSRAIEAAYLRFPIAPVQAPPGAPVAPDNATHASLLIQHLAWPRFVAAGFPAAAALVGRSFTATGIVDLDEDLLAICVLRPADLVLGP